MAVSEADWLGVETKYRAATSQNAVVQALFHLEMESVHDDFVMASECGHFTKDLSIRSFTPVLGRSSFVVDVAPESLMNYKHGIDRIVVQMHNKAAGNRPDDGVNSRDRVRPSTCEMIPISYGTVQRPVPRHPGHPESNAWCHSADAVQLMDKIMKM